MKWFYNGSLPYIALNWYTLSLAFLFRGEGKLTLEGGWVNFILKGFKQSLSTL